MSEKNSKYHILMLSGDTDLIQGTRGPFFDLLSEFSQYFEKISIVCTSVALKKEVQLNSKVTLTSFGRGPLGLLRALHFLFKTLSRDPRPNLLIGHDYGMFKNGMIAAICHLVYKIPVVSELHHIDGIPRATSWRDVCIRSLAKIYINLAKYYVAGFRIVNNGEMRDYLLKNGVEEKKIILSYSFFINPEIYFPPVQKKYLYDVLFVGRLASNKGIDIILDALYLVNEKGLKLKLLIRGTGPLEKKLKAKVIKLGLQDQVEFKSWLKDLKELGGIYRQSKVLVCASSCEGGPRVTLEAMACGTPVISTPVGIMSEIAHHRENALLFQWNAQELATCLIEIIQNEPLRENISATALKIIPQFERKRIIKKYAENYLELIRNQVGRDKHRDI